MTRDDAHKLIATIAAQFMAHGMKTGVEGDAYSYSVAVSSDEAIRIATDIAAKAQLAAANLYPKEMPL